MGQGAVAMRYPNSHLECDVAVGSGVGGAAPACGDGSVVGVEPDEGAVGVGESHLNGRRAVSTTCVGDRDSTVESFDDAVKRG